MAAPAHELEVGGVVGGAFTSVSNTGPCAVLVYAPTAPADECVDKPNDGAHGAVVGAHVRFRVLPPLELEAGLVYAQKGYTSGLEVRLHYLEAPLLLRFEPFAGAMPVRASLVAGLAPAMLLACHASGQIFINEAPPHAEMYSGPCRDLVGPLDLTPRRLDLSAVLGVGLGWQLGSGSLELQARYVRGLIDVDGWQESGKTVNDALYVLVALDRKL